MIKGLSQIRRLPRLGVIRLGVKKKSAKGIEYPTAVDYFVCPDEVKKVYGDKPKELNIILPLENIDDIFPQFYKRYGHSIGLKCKGDGELANQINEKTGEFEEVECLGQKCPNYVNKKCKEVATLNFLLPKVRLDGIYQLHTSSYHSIVKINSSLDYIKSMFGKISMIPLKLIVEGMEAHPDKKMRKIVYTLRIAFDTNAVMESIQKRETLLSQGSKTQKIEAPAEPKITPPAPTEPKPVKPTEPKPIKSAVPKVEMPSNDEKPDDLYPESTEEYPTKEQCEEEIEVKLCDVCQTALTDKEIKFSDTNDFKKNGKLMYQYLCSKCGKELGYENK